MNIFEHKHIFSKKKSFVLSQNVEQEKSVSFNNKSSPWEIKVHKVVETSIYD